MKERMQQKLMTETERILLRLIERKNEQIDYEGPSDTVKGIQLAIDTVTEYMRTKGE